MGSTNAKNSTLPFGQAFICSGPKVMRHGRKRCREQHQPYCPQPKIANFSAVKIERQAYAGEK